MLKFDTLVDWMNTLGLVEQSQKLPNHVEI